MFVDLNNVLKISAPDFATLKSIIFEFETSNPDSFLTSPLYYLLTGRKGLWLYKGQDSCLVVCLHPHIENCILVFPEIGKNPDYSLTASYLSKIKFPLNGIQFSRFNEPELDKLKRVFDEMGLRGSDIEMVEENVMDWRYPVRIIDTNVVSATKGPKFINIRTHIRRVAKSTTVIPLSCSNKVRLMKAAIRFWEGNMIYNEKDSEDMSAFYEELVRISSANSDCMEGLFFMVGRRPVGFTVWERQHRGTVNLLANISDISISGLSDFQLVTSCKYLQEKGIDYVNMGGSELESLDAFKRKYLPVKSISIFSAKFPDSGQLFR